MPLAVPVPPPRDAPPEAPVDRARCRARGMLTWVASVKWAVAVMAALAVLTLGGCAVLPPLPPRTESQALTDVADTPLAQLARASLPAAGAGAPTAAMSGFRLLVDGESAFNLRVAMIRRATRSLDLQTYAIAPDDTGRGLLRELRDAAARGVRVRLLVDDLHAGEVQPLLAGLAAHAGVEVRLFNPLPLRLGGTVARVLGSLHEFGRINRRMHNKLLVADNSLAITGGRNVADEYFMHDEDANFIDLDVLAAGPVVPELSRVFDRYWNHRQAYPIHALDGDRAAAQARAAFDHAVQDATTRLGERQRDSMGLPSAMLQLGRGAVTLFAAPARVLADTPDKASEAPPATARTVADDTLALLAGTRQHALILTPYFIPGEEALRIVRALGRERVTLVTNSLGSTDEPLTYGGYERHRLELLRLGVTIHELGPVLARESGRVAYFGRSQGQLHAKALAVDDARVFVGSLNLDPRSSHVNTEAGLLIDSPDLARQIGALVRQRLAAGSYRLRLAGAEPRIEWVETDWLGRETVHATEPHDSLWLRLRLWLLRRFVPDELL